jgi:hemolysin III
MTATNTTRRRDIPLHLRDKPRLRGRLHQGAFYVCIPAGFVLVVLAPGVAGKVGAAVYWATLLLQFGVSAAYHRVDWTEAGHARMRRLDHAMIFALIAGTYTPYCLTILGGRLGAIVLVLVWTGAAIGIATKLYRVDLHVLSGFMYIGLGWVAIFTLPALVRNLSGLELTLTFAGGILYSLGALVLALNRPDPWPDTFGYHEVWHTATLLAALCFYSTLVLVYTGA